MQNHLLESKIIAALNLPEDFEVKETFSNKTKEIHEHQHLDLRIQVETWIQFEPVEFGSISMRAGGCKQCKMVWYSIVN